jgi:hypothetical protein
MVTAYPPSTSKSRNAKVPARTLVQRRRYLRPVLKNQTLSGSALPTRSFAPTTDLGCVRLALPQPRRWVERRRLTVFTHRYLRGYQLGGGRIPLNSCMVVEVCATGSGTSMFLSISLEKVAVTLVLRHAPILPSGSVKNLEEVVRSGLLVLVRPEQVHHLLPMHTVPLSQNEQLHQVRSLFEAPATLLESLRPHREREVTEHARSHGLEHFDRSLSPAGAWSLDGHPLSPLHLSTLS